jgi:hypothetical protein
MRLFIQRLAAEEIEFNLGSKICSAIFKAEYLVSTASDAPCGSL